jgi:hypothetical protein
MQAHTTIHHPQLPFCTFHQGALTGFGADDFITITIGTALTNSVTLHFSPEEFLNWTGVLNGGLGPIRYQMGQAVARRERFRSMTSAQVATLMRLCKQFGVTFDPLDYAPQFDLPSGYVAGWIGGLDHGHGTENQTIYVGVDPEGAASS